MSIQFDAPVAEVWADDIQARRLPDPWRALNSSEVLTFSSQQNADQILQLAKAVTPDAQLVNGPNDSDLGLNFISDRIDSAVSYMLMHKSEEGVYPFAILGTYTGAGMPLKVLTYVSSLVREYGQVPGATRLVVNIKSGKADYDWAV